MTEPRPCPGCGAPISLAIACRTCWDALSPDLRRELAETAGTAHANRRAHAAALRKAWPNRKEES